MRISYRMLIFSILLSVLLLLGCAKLPNATPDSSAAEPPPGVVATSALPSTVPTAVLPAFTAQPALPERRRLTLEFPPKIRAGDSDVVRLTLEVDALGNLTPTAQIAGNTVTGQVIEVPNLYETHHVIAEARFDIAGVEVRPAELVSAPLSQGTSATFYWSVRPPDGQGAGHYRGTIWLYLRFVNKQNGEESRKTVSAQLLQIESVNFLGLSGDFARSTGVVGSVVGTVIGFPFFEDIVKFLFKRRNKAK